MKINDFELERYFGEHEFATKYLMSCSDCDGFELQYLLSQASAAELDLWHGMKLGYSESEGSSILRKAILKHYALKSIEHVVVASPGELNFISMNVLLEASDHVIAITPAYQSLHEVVISIKCEISYWAPNPDNWAFDVEDLGKLVKENTKLIIINFPHNPTGSYLSRRQLNDIIDIARKRNIYIFSDEMYHKLIIDQIEELPPICDLYENGISLWGTSKTFGLAGLRTGWLVSQDKNFLKKVLAFKDYLSICNSTPSEILSIIAINNIEKFLIPNISKIKNNVSIFKKFAAEHEIIESFVPPKAGSIAFVKLNIENTALDFSHQLVKKTGIMTVPAEMFNHSGKYIRVGFGRQNFPEVLESFGAYLKTYLYPYTND